MVSLDIILPNRGRIHTFKDDDEEISSVKEWISSKTGIPTDCLRLKCGRELCLDGVTLGHYALDDSWTLRAELVYFTITIPTAKETIEVSPADSTETVLEIKNIVKKKLDLSCELTLYFRGTLLEDNNILYNYKIFDDAVFDLRCSLMTVKITTQHKSTIALRVSLLDTVKSVKNQINDENGIPQQLQQLYFDETLLEDSKFLCDYQISAQSDIILQCFPVAMVIKTPDDNRFSLIASVFDSVTSLKNQIQAETRVPCNLQELRFNGKLLEDSGNILDYDISGSITVELVCSPMIAQIKNPQGKFVSLNVTLFDFVKSLKEQIAKADDTPVAEQILPFNGQELQDDTRLSDHHIGEDTLLEVLHVSGFYVLVQSSFYELFQVHLNPSDSILKLQTEIEERTGVRSTRQRLIVDKEPLKPDQLFSDVGIENGTLIRVEFIETVINVYVNFEPGRKLLVDIEPNASVAEVKLRIEEIEHLPVSEQSLRFDGVHLQDDKTLAEYGIDDGSAIELCYVIFVKSLSGKICEIEPEPTEMISSLKRRIAVLMDVPHEQQQLYFREKLEDEATLVKCGIKGNSTLTLVTSASERPRSEKMNGPLESSKEIVLKLLSGEIVTVEEKSSHSIGDFRTNLVKSRDDLKHVKVDDLLLLSNRELLDDVKPINSLNVSSECSVQTLIQPNSFFIILWVCRWEHAFIVAGEPVEKVFHFKQRIAKLLGVPDVHQLLIFRGRLMDDDTFLYDQGLRRGSLVFLERRVSNEFYLHASPSQARDIKIASQKEPGAIMRSVHLTGDLYLKDCSVSTGCSLHLMISKPSHMRIFVTSMDNRVAELAVSPGDVIGGLKVQLEREFDVPAHMQTLIFKGQVMSNGDTLAECNIHHEEHLMLVCSIPVIVKTLDNRTVTCQARDCEGEECIKRQVFEKLGIPQSSQRLLKAGGVELRGERLKTPTSSDPPLLLVLDLLEPCWLFVSTPSQETVPVSVSLKDSAASVKRSISCGYSFPAKRQKLMFESTVLEPEDRLMDVGVSAKCTLLLDDNDAEFQFYVKINRTKMKAVKLSSSSTIADLKTKLSQSEDVPLAAISVLRNGREIPEQNTLNKVAIKQGSIVSVIIRHHSLPLHVRSSCEWSGTIKVSLSCSIRTVMQVIEQESSIPLESQRLFLNGKLLTEQQSFLLLGVEAGTTIFVERKDQKKMWLFFKDKDGDVRGIAASPADSVASVKRMLSEELDIDAGNICLMKDEHLQN